MREPAAGEFSGTASRKVSEALDRVPAFARRRHYGGHGTVHHTGTIDIQVNWETREVKAVWFRCLSLPFTASEICSGDPVQHVVNPDIAIEEITYADLREESSQ